MKDPSRASVSFYLRWRQLLARYRVQTVATLAVLAALSLLAQQVVPGYQDLIVRQGIIPYLTLLIVLDLAATQAERDQDDGLQLAANQDEALPVLVSHVPSCGTSGVDLLEYAASTTLPLIRAISREGVALRLLVKHPDTVTGMDRQVMLATLDTLYNSIFAGRSDTFEARCYRQPFSLRARRIGRTILELGWLTPHIERETAYGHANPSLLLDISAGEHDVMLEFFDRTFDELWTASDSEDGLAVLNESLRAGASP